MEYHYLITRSSPTDQDFLEKLEDVLDQLEKQNLVFLYSEDKNLNDYIKISIWEEVRERGFI
jgi:hypothetical protein